VGVGEGGCGWCMAPTQRWATPVAGVWRPFSDGLHPSLVYGALSGLGGLRVWDGCRMWLHLSVVYDVLSAMGYTRRWCMTPFQGLGADACGMGVVCGDGLHLSVVYVGGVWRPFSDGLHPSLVYGAPSGLGGLRVWDGCRMWRWATPGSCDGFLGCFCANPRYISRRRLYCSC